MKSITLIFVFAVGIALGFFLCGIFHKPCPECPPCPILKTFVQHDTIATTEPKKLEPKKTTHTGSVKWVPEKDSSTANGNIPDSTQSCCDSLRTYENTAEDSLLVHHSKITVLGHLIKTENFYNWKDFLVTHNTRDTVYMPPVATKLRNQWLAGGSVGSDTSLCANIFLINKKGQMFGLGNNLLRSQPNIQFTFAVSLGRKK